MNKNKTETNAFSKTPKELIDFMKENEDSLYIGKALEFLELSYIVNIRDRTLHSSKDRRTYLSIAKRISKVFDKYKKREVVEGKLEKILRNK